MENKNKELTFKDLHSYELAFDKPICYIPKKYKNKNDKELKFYPVKLLDYDKLQLYSQSLTYDKLETNNPELIAMNNLEYLFYICKLNSENKISELDETGKYDARYGSFQKFACLLSLCLNEPNLKVSFYYNVNNKLCIGLGEYKIKFKKANKIGLDSLLVTSEPSKFELNYNVESDDNVSINIDYLISNGYDFKVGDIVNPYMEYDYELNYKDFDEIKRIIMYQNFIDYDDRYIDLGLKELLEEEKRLKNIHAPKNLSTNLLKQILTVSLNFGYKKEEIENLTVHTFFEMLKMVLDKETYDNMCRLRSSGMVKVDDKDMPPHYMYEKDTLFDGMESLDSFKKKIQ